jgi:4-hydroxy-3-methylbut-2-enyl diphosphate reductase IspH
MTVRRADGVSYEPSGDSVVILDADGAVMRTLNEVGTLIWNGLSDHDEVPGIVSQLAERFPEVAESQLVADVEEFIASLAEANLVVVD